MVEHRLWYLSLSKHAGLPDGVDVKGPEQSPNKLWERFAAQAEKMEVGTHDLTPPTLVGKLSAFLLVHANFHGIHKVDDSSGRAKFERESALRFMTSSAGPGIRGHTVVRLPEDTPMINVSFSVNGAPSRLYYMLRWLESPLQDIRVLQREFVGARVGIERDEP